jgi:GT2 family glycosyltransferase
MSLRTDAHASPAAASPATQPTVSIVLPTLNEQSFIADCLRSLLAQDYRGVSEILVVDGGSTDRTRQIAEGLGPPVRIVDNPRVTAAAAMNAGIAAAAGEVIVRADAHSLYDPGYVGSCVRVLEETDADNVGGGMRAVGTTRFGRAVAAVTSSPFGVGPGRFHYSQEREEVDTVYLGCWRKSTLQRFGGFDEEGLQWAAEDQDLNFRIRSAGGRIVLDPSIRSWYFPRETPRALARQYFNYGVCKASTLKKHRSLPSWRPLAPAALVAVAALLLPSRRLRFAVPIAHLGGAAVVARKVAKESHVSPIDAAKVVAICHWAYGLGFWSGIGRIVSGRPFVTRPGGHR